MEYINGKVTYSNKNYVVLEANSIGHKIYINDSMAFDNNQLYRIYIYQKVSQTNKGNFLFEYYGFKDPQEKIFFEQLINLNGIGPKTALNILKTNLDELKSLIKTKDYKALETLPGFNKKIAWQIINDISYKLNFEFKNENHTTNNNQTITTKISDLVSALKALGYKKEEVEIALSEIPLKIENYRSMELSDLISETIKIIIGGNESNSIKAN